MTEDLHDVRLSVNGVPHDVRVPARRLLSDALRHDLGLTGTHVGCEHGVCGACTVLVDGRPMRSCLVFAVSAVDAEITTVEGLTNADGSLGPVQQAFAECHGLQCGFCTPGFLTTITAGLREHPYPTEDDAREMISGNLCRCTGYVNIVRSVLRAAELAEEPALVEEVAQPLPTLVEEVAQPLPPLVEEVAEPLPPLVEEVAQQPSRDPATGAVGFETGARAPSSTSGGPAPPSSAGGGARAPSSTSDEGDS